MKDFTGYIVCSRSPCCRALNNRVVERTIRKAFPNDKESTLYIVKLKGISCYQQLYENEMIK